MSLTVDYVPLPPELDPAWRTAMLMLLDILMGNQQEPVNIETGEEPA